jgi:hypothetical protein
VIRTQIWYGGKQYVVGQTPTEVIESVDEILASGRPGWLTANFGLGRNQPARLLIAPGVSLSVVDANEPKDQELDESSNAERILPRD